MSHATQHSQEESARHPVVAAILDAAMWSLRGVRRELVPRARGRVLEIGVGTGANLPYYDDAAVEEVVGVDPDPHMLRRARGRAAKLALPVELRRHSGETLPFADHSFDTLVATWVLCTIEQPARAVAEMRRVLKPRGELLFAEHTVSRFPRAAKLQRRLSPMWSRFAAGCRLDRDSVALIRSAGFREIEVRTAGRERLTLTPVYYGSARG